MKKAAAKSAAAENAAPRKRATKAASAKAEAAGAADARAQSALSWLKRHSSKATRDGMARYGLPSDRALGVTMADMLALAKRLGRDHALAAALWDTGVYEARMVASMVDDPAQVTVAQMDRWCKDFDNWGLCDTVCFKLFDRAPHAWAKVTQWSGKREEFVRRAAFALLWGLTVHDKQAADAKYIEGLRLIERAAGDERNFVKKAVNMALRATGKRNRALNAAAVATAKRLADASNITAQWVGKDALRELTSPAVTRRLVA
ncbi:DNA alkylation repair protein [Luteimonas sp. SX5]|uniref:DNA alkylation repair protein n=1 Tax=Luteimonas galliterrae TaxID=2940486 RepID=A0ABT0MM74_9GAMM|nr:DNA alkylation repair protein [Luteimonas galliterrae]MCL1635984.1 DNA alkylation repair protein [Luteimonas galliterrae]